MEMITGVREFIARGIRSKTGVNTLWLGGSSVVNGIAGAITSAIFGRYLGVSDFGTLTLIFSLMNLLTDLADLGLVNSVVRFGSQSVAEGNTSRLSSILAIVLRAKVVVGSVIIVASIVFLRPLVSYFFNHVNEQVEAFFLLSLVAVILNIAAVFFFAVYQSFGLFRNYSLLSTLRNGAKLVLVCACVFVLSRISVAVAVWTEIISVGLFLVALYGFSPVRRFSLSASEQGLQKQVFAFNKWMSMAYLINLFGGRLDVFLVGGLSDSHELGLYAASSKIASLIIVVTNSYLTVLLADLSASTSREAVQRKTRSSVAVISILVGCILAIAVFAYPVVAIVFGQQFAGAAMVLRIMCLGLAFTVAAYPFNASLFAMNKSAAFPLTSACSIATLGLGNAYLVPSYGAVGAATAFGASGVVTFVVLLSSYLFVRNHPVVTT